MTRPPRPTVRDIARRVGASPGAVSFALNDKPGVSEATRARILEVANELGWRPNRTARALGSSRVGMIGMVWARDAPTLGAEPFFAQIVAGLDAGLSQHDIGLQLRIVGSVDEEVAIHRRWAAEQAVDALLLLDLRRADPRVAELERSGFPCLVFGGPGGQGKLPAAWVDDRAAMLRILDHLASLGHRVIGHVAGPPELWHTRRRMRAAQDYARRAAIRITSVPAAYSEPAAAAATERLLAAPTPPTALVFDSDVMAVTGLRVAQRAGYLVPERLSVVSFDDSALARMMQPSLTALTRDTFATGVLLAERLLRVIDGAVEARTAQLPTPSLVVRESTGLAPRP